MQPTTRAFLTRAIAPPILLGSVAAIGMALTPQPPAVAAPVPAIVQAEQQVAAQAADLTEGRTCWTDPTGHDVTSAIVKDVDGVTAYRVTAETAWDAAHAGDVWVIAWCGQEQGK